MLRRHLHERFETLYLAGLNIFRDLILLVMATTRGAAMQDLTVSKTGPVLLVRLASTIQLTV